MTTNMRFLKILAGFALAAGAGALTAPTISELARGFSIGGPAQEIAGDGAIA
jgi:hypothetical protein